MSSPAALRIIQPGMLSIVQDLGRVGQRGNAVVGGGAADRLALRLGNRLLGNAEDAAAIELTLTGCVFEALAAMRVLVAGECEIAVQHVGTRSPLNRWRVHDVTPGPSLIVGAMRRGARAYVCIAGGIDVPLVLGSRSTHLGAAFGGHEGRELRKGDLLAIGHQSSSQNDANTRDTACDVARRLHDECAFRKALRCVSSAHTDRFDDAAIESLYTTEFVVSNQSDRRGVRLIGSISARAGDGAMPSEGMMLGAIQIPPGGEPIILGVDHPATGGYPLIGCVIEADHATLAQLRPGDRVRLEHVSLDDARRAMRDLEAEITTIEVGV